MRNKEKIQTLVNEITDLLVNKFYDINFVNEASGFDGIFDELKTKLTDIAMLPDNVIDAGKYKEHEIIEALKSIGYEYKKPMSGKLHFFNKKTSISLYLIQKDSKITLMP
jgi:predicted HicB family RNase H-like nuclease